MPPIYPYLLMAAFLAWTPVAAQECLTPRVLIDRAATAGAIVVADLRGDKADAFMVAYNRIPPPTTYEGNRVIVFVRQRILVTAVVFSAGCSLTYVNFSAAAFLRVFPDINTFGREVTK